jgi:hypothetical protein
MRFWLGPAHSSYAVGVGPLCGTLLSVRFPNSQLGGRRFRAAFQNKAFPSLLIGFVSFREHGRNSKRTLATELRAWAVNGRSLRRRRKSLPM